MLRSLRSQTVKPGAVVVADDGSDSLTSEVIGCWQQELNLKHVWQPNSGFRAARARNLGVAKLLGTDNYYTIMIDGDCVLPPNFIEMHNRLRATGWMVAGGRFLMGAGETWSLFSEAGPNAQDFTEFKFRHIPLGFIRRLRPRNWKIVRTCNVSMWLDDFLGVAGFDEAFLGWGKEDSDLVVRLIRSGVRIINGRLAASVKHLHHGEMDRSRLVQNEAIFQRTLDLSEAARFPTRSIFNDDNR